MSTHNFHHDFNFIMDQLRTRLGITNAIVRRLEGDELVTAGYFGYDEAEARLRIFIGQGVTGRCAAERRTVIIDDLAVYRGQYLAGISGARSELCVPLELGGRLVGTLNIESVERANFTPVRIALVARLANLLAHSIADPDNAAGLALARTLAMLEAVK